MKVEHPIFVPEGLLHFVPLDFGYVLGDHFLKADHNLVRLIAIADQRLGVSKKSVEIEPSRNPVRCFQYFRLQNTTDVKRPYRAVQRRSADHVLAMAMEQHAVRTDGRPNDLPFDQGVVSNSDLTSFGECLQQQFVMRF